MSADLKFFVINLDRSPERLEMLQAHFERFGLDLTRIPAIDGKTLTLEQRQKTGRQSFSVDGGDALSDTNAAISLSHLKALQAFLDGGSAYAVVLEDDALLNQATLDVIHTVLAKVHHMRRFDGLELAGWGHSANVIVPEFSAGTYTVGRSKKSTPGAAVMLYSRRGAQKILASAYPIRTHWDNYLSLGWAHGARFLTVRPFPARQNPAFISTYAEDASLPQARKTFAARVKRFIYRAYQGPRKFFSDALWLGLPAMLKVPGSFQKLGPEAKDA